MISHKYRCIFVHLPRTGGSSFEHAIIGKNWWSIEPKSKHLLASQAKKLYSPYWDDYFKFAIVRNPWDRCVSLLQFASIYYGSSGSELTKGMLDWYKERFGYPVTIEYDYRFYTREEVWLPEHKGHQVYGNVLDEDLDFVARFESLESDFTEIAKTIGLASKALPRKAQSKDRGPYDQYYSDELKAIVGDLYQNDISEYGYGF